MRRRSKIIEITLIKPKTFRQNFDVSHPIDVNRGHTRSHFELDKGVKSESGMTDLGEGQIFLASKYLIHHFLIDSEDCRNLIRRSARRPESVPQTNKKYFLRMDVEVCNQVLSGLSAQIPGDPLLDVAHFAISVSLGIYNISAASRRSSGPQVRTNRGNLD